MLATEAAQGKLCGAAVPVLIRGTSGYGTDLALLFWDPGRGMKLLLFSEEHAQS